jgi:hypothetical protein
MTMGKGKPVAGSGKKSPAPSYGKKRGVGKADARSFADFGDVGGQKGDPLMGDGSDVAKDGK